MNEHEEISRIVSLVKEDVFLSELIGAADPQAILMPFAQEAQKHYIFIGVFVTEQASKREVLVAICKRILVLLKSDQYVKNLHGIEIMPCLLQDGKTKRIFRLSVLSSALQKAELIESADIDLAEPAEGITCILYKRDI